MVKFDRKGNYRNEILFWGSILKIDFGGAKHVFSTDPKWLNT